MKKLLFIVMILTLSSCMVSTKVFDAKINEMQKQLDSQQTEFRLKEELLREQVNNLWKEVEKDTLTDKEIEKIF